MFNQYDSPPALRLVVLYFYALEAGYCAGNHHWKVRFEPDALLIATQGPAEHYVERLEHLVTSGRIAWRAE